MLPAHLRPTPVAPKQPPKPSLAFTTSYRVNIILGALGVSLVLAGFFVPIIVSTFVEEGQQRTLHFSLLDLLEHDIGNGILSAFGVAAVLVLVGGIAAGGILPLRRPAFLALCAAAVIAAAVLTMWEVKSMVSDLRAQAKAKPRNELFVGKADPEATVDLDLGLAVSLAGACVLFIAAFYPPKTKRVIGVSTESQTLGG